MSARIVQGPWKKRPSRWRAAGEWVVCFIAFAVVGALFGVVLEWLP